LFGHLACGFCRDQLDTGRCLVCDFAGAYSRSTAMEDMVRSTRIQCPYDAYGCRSYVTYYAADEHQRSCPHAPCLCSEPDCGGFAGTPAALLDHLRDAHSWPVDRVRYGATLQLRVPESDPALQRRLLVADEEDGAVFLLAVGALGDAPLRVVSLVCARPVGAAAAGPRYACRMRAAGPADDGKGDVESVVAEMAVPSSAAPGEASVEEAASLVVLRRMLHGESREMHIGVRVDRTVEHSSW
jgi:E3 ubiquitin-protein ligase SIAH1